MSGTFTNLLYHIVYSTKYRRKTIAKSWQPDLYRYITGVIKERDGIPIEIGGVSDHIHILAKLSPKLAIMDVLRDIKALSSKWVNDQKLLSLQFEWQAGYGAFSVSSSKVEVVQPYIQNQEDHHQEKSFKSEFVSLLMVNNIPFDPKYVFDEEIIT